MGTGSAKVRISKKQFYELKERLKTYETSK
jgi:hypothetical protein